MSERLEPKVTVYVVKGGLLEQVYPSVGGKETQRQVRSGRDWDPISAIYFDGDEGWGYVVNTRDEKRFTVIIQGNASFDDRYPELVQQVSEKTGIENPDIVTQ